MMKEDTSRRKFLKTSLAVPAALAVGTQVSTAAEKKKATSANALPTRQLGKNGPQVIRQPDMQWELRRLTNRTDEEQNADQGCGGEAKDAGFVMNEHIQVCFGEDFHEAQGAGLCEEVGNAQQHEDITDAGGHEGFLRRIAGGFFAVPEANQQVGA